MRSAQHDAAGPAAGRPAARRREILLEDERGTGAAAVVRHGPYVFVSGSEGRRDLASGGIDARVTGDPEAQVHNAYGRICRDLERCGLSGDCVAWIEHFVAAQDWLLLRLALWQRYFGGRATGGGAESKMAGSNLVTAVAVAIDPAAEHRVLQPAPTGSHEGHWAAMKAWVERAYAPGVDLDGVRPPKTVLGGDLVFLIGVRGFVDPVTGAPAPAEHEDTARRQLHNGYAEYAALLGADGRGLDALVRVDAPMRDVAMAQPHRALAREQAGGATRWVTHTFGQPMGGRGQVDMVGVAARSPAGKRLVLGPTGGVDAVVAGGLVFSAPCSGLQDARSGAFSPELYGDKRAQAQRALDRLEVVLDAAGSSAADLVRIDAFLQDPYFEGALYEVLASRLGDVPTVNVVAGELERSAQVELLGVAGHA